MAGSDTSVLAGPSGLTRMRGRLKEARVPWIPAIILAGLLILGIGADLVAPFDPTESNLRAKKIEPFTNVTHPLGTDIVGKDMLSRLIHGARSVLKVTVPAMAIAVVVGTTIGLTPGYAGKWVEAVLMRITDVTLGFPALLVAMLIVTLIGTGVMGVIVAVTATTWARFARMCDRVAVMYAGKFVEQANVEQLFDNPSHPYAEALLKSVPDLDTEVDILPSIEGQPPSPEDLPEGCAFDPRCPYVFDKCDEYPPGFLIETDHIAHCWRHDGSG